MTSLNVVSCWCAWTINHAHDGHRITDGVCTYNKVKEDQFHGISIELQGNPEKWKLQSRDRDDDAQKDS